MPCSLKGLIDRQGARSLSVKLKGEADSDTCKDATGAVDATERRRTDEMEPVGRVFYPAFQNGRSVQQIIWLHATGRINDNGHPNS